MYQRLLQQQKLGTGHSHWKNRFAHSVIDCIISLDTRVVYLKIDDIAWITERILIVGVQAQVGVARGRNVD